MEEEILKEVDTIEEVSEESLKELSDNIGEEDNSNE